jgi:tetratricopeptide (TPR) repeat protein
MRSTEWKDILVNMQDTKEAEIKNADVYNSRGNILLERGQYEQAAVEYRNALKLDEKLAPANFNLALCCEKMEKFDEALKYYEISMKLDESFPLTRVRIDIVHQRKALKSNENNFNAWMQLGVDNVNIQQYDEAMEAFMKALALSQDVAIVHFYLGTCFLHKGWYDRAIEALKQAMELGYKFPDCYSNMGVSYFELGKYREAIEEISKALELNPYNPLYFFNLGSCYAAQGMKAEAKEEFKKGLELDPQSQMIKNAINSL